MKNSYLKKVCGLVALAMLIIFLLPVQSFAAESLTLSTNAVSVEVDKIIEVAVQIDTGGSKVNAVGFSIDFSTENLEGLTPRQSGSAFPMCATLSPTRYECGATGRDGFSGQGLVTTLLFKGRQAGQTSISITNFEARYGPTGSSVPGFSVSGIDNITVYGSGEKPPTPSTSSPRQENSTPSVTPVIIPTPASASSDLAPKPITGSVSPNTPATALSTPGTTSGSAPQVTGTLGAQPEEPLKPQDQGVKQETVKGLFQQSKISYSFIPTILLFALAIYLGMKLFFTEKRRHLEVERLFESEIGTLAALESKLDLLDQKGEEAKEDYIQEFEEVKNKIRTEENVQLTGAKPEVAVSTNSAGITG